MHSREAFYEALRKPSRISPKMGRKLVHLFIEVLFWQAKNARSSSELQVACTLLKNYVAHPDNETLVECVH